MPAQVLYNSPLFNKSATVARLMGDRWYILSAKHGLLSPSQVIEPYDETLNEMPKSERLRWAEGVLAHLLTLTKCQDTVVFLAGKRYREFIAPELQREGYSVDIPMEGMAIGKQLSWLNRAITRAEAEV